MRYIGENDKPLYRHVVFKIFWPDNKRFTMFAMKAPEGRALTAKDIDDMLESMAAKVETLFPGQRYELLGLGAFNFVASPAPPVVVEASA